MLIAWIDPCLIMASAVALPGRHIGLRTGTLQFSNCRPVMVQIGLQAINNVGLRAITLSFQQFAVQAALHTRIYPYEKGNRYERRKDNSSHWLGHGIYTPC
jgi:hypothetical protein